MHVDYGSLGTDGQHAAWKGAASAEIIEKAVYFFHALILKWRGDGRRIPAAGREKGNEDQAGNPW